MPRELSIAWRVFATVLGACIVGSLGCSSSDVTVDEPDTKVVTDVQEMRGGDGRGDALLELPRFDWRVPDKRESDGGTTWCMEPGGSGCGCASNDDCLSGWCVFHLGGKLCTETCVTECPAGWSCEPAPGPDPVFVCASLYPSLCLPCTKSDDCKDLGGGKCVVYGPKVGAFCGAGCDEGSPCPAGYECKQTETTEDQTSSQCVLVEGECSCTDYAIAEEAQTGCTVTNEFGACPGWRVCSGEGLSGCSAATPAEETCDGVDNDCDGDADDGDLCEDGNECTKDLCQTMDGCVNEPLDGVACFDGDTCTYDDHCEAGQCVGTALDCDDSNGCTDDWCDAEAACLHEGNSEPCEDDGDPCTEDLCSGGECIHPPGNDGATCEDDTNPCTVDLCDAGECTHPPGNDGEPCVDDDPCTVEEHCEAGFCMAGGVKPICLSPCGDGVCSMSPADVDCPVDCGPCGDGVCGIHEAGQNGGTCPKDCLAACGDGKCEGGEGVFCIIDCSGCGDGVCGLGESPQECPVDCPVPCGDGECGFGETPFVCPVDCTPPCGDGICQTGENPYNCPEDCVHCGDGICGVIETEENCPQDCDTPCGNGACDGNETSDGCPVDCGPCGDGTCGFSESEQSCPADCWEGCGDGECQAYLDETKDSCPADCIFDKDGDGVEDEKDNCAALHNPEQEDFDEDGVGDLCDPDDDGDGDLDATDCAPLDAAVSHLAAEVCNGIDDDCSGEADEDAPCPDGESCHEGQCQVICGDGKCGESEDQCSCPADCGDPCEGKKCGDDGCGGSCGTCQEWEQCIDGECTCVPDCGGQECGPDGCNGSCGECSDTLACTNDSCDDDGMCVFEINDFSCVIEETCLPSETVHPDNPCQECKPTLDKIAWSNKDNAIGCGNNAECLDGECFCLNEKCGETCCDAGQVCHEEACCSPDCGGKECGDDSCGGSCGQCSDPLVCTVDTCENGTCVFTPDDACVIGGNCYAPEEKGPGFCLECTPGTSTFDWTPVQSGTTCGNNAECQDGVCGCIAEECNDECCKLGAVCFENACCSPDCIGEECGDDGCGGSCGECDEHYECADGACLYVPWCGDLNCDAAEDCATCPGDCGDCCGNGACDNGETCETCPADCGSCVTAGFVKIDAGSFWMGSPAGGGEQCPVGYEGGGCDGTGAGTTVAELGRYSDETLHYVKLTQDFEIQVHEVTQGEWKAAFGGWNPSYYPACGDNCPVEYISWYDSLAYANWKSEQVLLTPCYVFSGVKCEDGLDVGSNYQGCLNGTQKGIDSGTVTLAGGSSKPYTCTGFRLPTEAEWEYAARAGSETAFYPSLGNDGSITQTGATPLDPNLDQIGWYLGNNTPSGTKTVGGKAGNDWGLKDMSGNVREWCWDWYETYPGGTQAAPEEDPYGSEGSYRVGRGGGWYYGAEDCRSANRFNGSPGYRNDFMGARLARTLPQCGDGVCSGGETCATCPGDCACGQHEECVQATTGGWVCAAKTVSIAAGSFWMGCNNCAGSSVNDTSCRSDEHPYHEVYLNAYEIDRTEVTAAQYLACKTAGACSPAGSGSYGTYEVPGKEDHPVNYVNWSQAGAYCLWASKRLCTEAEWEKAARGGCEKNGGPLSCKAQSRKYPWGNDAPTCDLAAMFGCDGDTQPVCSVSPAGDSPYGLCDMAGNVWEWVADRYQKDYYCDGDAASGDGDCTECGSWPGSPNSWNNPFCEIGDAARGGRGGSFNDNLADSYRRVSYRGSGTASGSYFYYGSRCCRSVCGDGVCDEQGGEDCSNCIQDCGCGEGNVCFEDTCCTPDCDGKECGSDGCGGSCGECAGCCLGSECMSGNTLSHCGNNGVACDQCTGGEVCEAGECACEPGVSSGKKTNGQYGVVWVEIPAGCFMMGCSPGDADCQYDEKPPHAVTVSAFEMLETEVTEAQWAAAVPGDPTPSCDHNGGGGADSPVECINWNEAKAFCEAVDPKGRLCTEAEWEYAARGGTTTRRYCGDDSGCLDEVAWYESNSGNHKHDVKEQDPNDYGLYDMLGNVHEWAEDCWHSNYDLNNDGEGDWDIGYPAWTTNCSGSFWPWRGGSFACLGDYVRASNRLGGDPSFGSYALGGRCCKSLEP